MPLEQLAYASGLAGKGYLSEVERGLGLPSLVTLEKLADCLEVELVDMVNQPERGRRAELIEQTRRLSSSEVEALLGMARSYSETRETGRMVAERSEPYRGRRGRRR